MTLIQDVMRGLGDSHRLQLRSGFHWLCPKLGGDCTFLSGFGTNSGGGGERAVSIKDRSPNPSNISTQSDIVKRWTSLYQTGPAPPHGKISRIAVSAFLSPFWCLIYNAEYEKSIISRINTPQKYYFINFRRIDIIFIHLWSKVRSLKH